MHNLLPDNIFNILFFRGDSDQKKIYLTYDDGPHPENSPLLLDLFDDLNIKTTLFMIGENVQQHPALVQDAARRGHSIQNHGFHHHPLWFRSVQAIEQSLRQTNDLIEDLTRQQPTCFRPPYGRFGLNTIRACKNLGMKIVLWNVLPRDFLASVTGEQIKTRVQKGVSPGSIVVGHENIPFQKHAESLLEIVEYARGRGYSFDKLV
jgi:peptidoglycan/xylan/chitin deacetylase (PgdA/CDA1 family)